MDLWLIAESVDLVIHARYLAGGVVGVDYALDHEDALEHQLSRLGAERNYLRTGDYQSYLSVLTSKPAGESDILPGWCVDAARGYSRSIARQRGQGGRDSDDSQDGGGGGGVRRRQRRRQPRSSGSAPAAGSGGAGGGSSSAEGGNASPLTVSGPPAASAQPPASVGVVAMAESVDDLGDEWADGAVPGSPMLADEDPVAELERIIVEAGVAVDESTADMLRNLTARGFGTIRGAICMAKAYLPSAGH